VEGQGSEESGRHASRMEAVGEERCDGNLQRGRQWGAVHSSAAVLAVKIRMYIVCVCVCIQRVCMYVCMYVFMHVCACVCLQCLR